MKTLLWLYPLMGGRQFAHWTVRNVLANLVGASDSRQFSKRASEMIAFSKKMGLIKPAPHAVRYYIFDADEVRRCLSKQTSN
jgi:hypothetical protein